jgi:hypothetical protein
MTRFALALLIIKYAIADQIKMVSKNRGPKTKGLISPNPVLDNLDATISGNSRMLAIRGETCKPMMKPEMGIMVPIKPDRK